MTIYAKNDTGERPHKPGRVIKARSGELYVVEAVTTNTTGGLLYRAYRLSAYDGMPIGPIVHVQPADLVEEDQ